MATLIGILDHTTTASTFSLDWTLEEALPDVDWFSVSQKGEKKQITVRQILSMSSGLSANCIDYGPQDSAEAVLSSPTFTDSEEVRNVLNIVLDIS